MTLLPSDVARATYVVDAHDAGGLLKDALGLDGRGRKSAFTARLFLIGGLLTLQEKKHLVVADIYRTLTTAVDRENQVKLGIRETVLGPPTFSDGAVERFSARLAEKLDYGHGSAPDIDDADREARRVALMGVVDAMLKATLPPRQFAAFALDTSGIWAWGRAPRRAPKGLVAKDVVARDLGVDLHDLDLSDPVVAAKLAEAELKSVEAAALETPSGGPGSDSSAESAATVAKAVVAKTLPYERDAAWGVKTAKDGRRESVYGFDFHALVRAPDVGGDPTREAKLIQSIDVTPAHQDVVDTSLRMIDRVRDAKVPFAELLADRHYSYKVASRWATQLTARGIEQVVDLHQNDQNFRDYNGAKLAAGWLHCPGTPAPLGKIVHPGPGATKEQKQAFGDEITKRKAYALRRISVTGSRRFQCPALAGTVGCPLREGTVDIAIEGNLPLITTPPAAETAPTCCTQSTVELKEDGQRKLWQREYWGSKPWVLSNNRRTYVEGAFGNIKNPSTENLSRGTFRITGLGPGDSVPRPGVRGA